MSMTPVHPNAMLDRALTREELLDLVEYEGLVGLDPRDTEAALTLVAESKISLVGLKGSVHCLRESDRIER
jgi:hypothetical protein